VQSHFSCSRWSTSEDGSSSLTEFNVCCCKDKLKKNPTGQVGPPGKKQSLTMKRSVSEHLADQEAVLSAVVSRLGTQDGGFDPNLQVLLSYGSAS